LYTDFTFTYVSDQLNTKQPSAPVFSGSFSHLLACRPNKWSIMVSELMLIPAQVMVEISGLSKHFNWVYTVPLDSDDSLSHYSTTSFP